MLTKEQLKEEWKPVRGYEGFYLASSYGRIKSVSRKTKSNSNKGIREIKGKILSPGTKSNGYLVVVLSVNGIKKTHHVHSLIVETFMDKPYWAEIPNHVDGNKKNNHINNIEWSTYSENLKHAYQRGLR